MLALRYAALLILVIWIGGLLALGAIAAPAIFDVLSAREAADGRLLAGAVFGETLRRFHLVTYAAGGLLLVTLLVRGVLGPRPKRFGWRLAIALLMLLATVYSGWFVAGAHHPAATRHQRRTLQASRRRSTPAGVRPPARVIDRSPAGAASWRTRPHLLGAQRMTDIDRDELLPALRSAIAAAPNAESAMKQTVRLLKDGVPDYTWVGIYVVDGDELVLGPFLGKPSPHTRIPLGQGICGAAATEKATIVVDDVNADPRYLACSIETQVGDRRADHAGR